MTRRKASLVAALAGPLTSGSAAYSSNSKLHRVEDAARQLAVAETSRAAFRRRLVERRAQQGHLGEVVEMAGLQRCVLAIVREAEELAGLGLEVAVALQLDERPDRQDRRRRAAIVHAERRQLGAFGALALRVGHPARGLKAEQEVPADQRRRAALPFGHEASRRIHEDRLGHVPAKVGSDAIRTRRRGFLHERRQPLEQRCPVAPRPRCGFRKVEIGIAAAVVVFFATIFAGQEPRSAVVAGQLHAVVGRAALAAEDQRKERLVGLARLGDLLRHVQMSVGL